LYIVRSLSLRERGSVTAEFAAVVPAVILVLACCLGGLQLAAQHLRLQDVAASAARAVARGESLGATAELAARLVPGARVSSQNRGSMVCVNASAPGSIGGGVITVGASSCALAGGK
jgi:Flp pilus assembly protein TadG